MQTSPPRFLLGFQPNTPRVKPSLSCLHTPHRTNERQINVDRARAPPALSLSRTSGLHPRPGARNKPGDHARAPLADGRPCRQAGGQRVGRNPSQELDAWLSAWVKRGPSSCCSPELVNVQRRYRHRGANRRCPRSR